MRCRHCIACAGGRSSPSPDCIFRPVLHLVLAHPGHHTAVRAIMCRLAAPRPCRRAAGVRIAARQTLVSREIGVVQGGRTARPPPLALHSPEQGCRLLFRCIGACNSTRRQIMRTRGRVALGKCPPRPLLACLPCVRVPAQRRMKAVTGRQVHAMLPPTNPAFRRAARTPALKRRVCRSPPMPYASCSVHAACTLALIMTLVFHWPLPSSH